VAGHAKDRFKEVCFVSWRGRTALNRFSGLAQPTGSGEYVRRRVISEIINAQCLENGRVLDLGAGAGNLFGAVRADLRDRYVVVDVLQGPYGHRVVGDLTAAPVAGDSADCVCLSDVLEHLVRDVDAVREAIRIVRPSGYVVLHVPSLRTKPYAFLQRAADAAESADHQQFPHVRDGYSDSTLRSMLAEVPEASVLTIRPSFSAIQSLLSDIDAWLWWRKLTALRVSTWVGIRLASSHKWGGPRHDSSSGYVAVLQKVPS
jgi:SAM-dependent methyltransferase